MLERLTVREKVAILLCVLLATAGVNVGAVYVYQSEVESLDNSEAVASNQQVRAQEMARFSQRLSAEPESTEVRTELNRTIEQYSQSLAALDEGGTVRGQQLPAAPDRVSDDLDANRRLWREYREHIRTIRREKPVNSEYRESRQSVETTQRNLDAAIDSVLLAYETSGGNYSNEREAARRLKVLNAQISSQVSTISTNEQPGESSLTTQGSKNLLERRIDEFDRLLIALETGGEFEGTAFQPPPASAESELDRLSTDWQSQKENGLVVATQSKFNTNYVTSLAFVQNNTQALVDRSQAVSDEFSAVATQQQSFLQQLLFGLFGINLLAFAGGVYFSNRYIGRPIRELTETANRIASGEISGNVGTEERSSDFETERDEIRRLTGSFSEMHQTLQTVTEQADALASQRFDEEVLDEDVPGEFGHSLHRMQTNLRELIREQRETTQELKEKNDQLQRNRDLLDRTQKIADVGGWELDVMADGMSWTDEMYTIFDVRPDHDPTPDWIIEEGVHPEDADYLNEAVEAAIVEGEEFEIEVRIETGDEQARWIRVSGKPVYSEDGDQVVQVRGAAQDITEQKRRKRELEQYETLVETAANPMWFLGPDGTVAVLNEAMADQIGAPKEEILGTPARDILQEQAASRGEETVQELLASEQDKWSTQEWWTETDSGEERLFEVTVSVLVDDEEFLGSVGIFRDITERARKQEKLERQNERLDRFASIISHDLRNPLGIAETYLDFARETGDGDDFDAVEEALERMDAMIDDLLAFARGGTIEKMDLVRLTAISNEAWDNVDTDDATLSLALRDTHIEADADKLLNVFENFFRNSIEHGGDTVTVGTLNDADGFYVEDDGPGIPADKRDEVFEHGFTDSESGTGFGLSIVQTIVEAHGWTVRVTQSEDDGARFEIAGVTTDESGTDVRDSGRA